MAAVRPVHILEVKGRIDAIVANFLARSLVDAQEEDAEVVVIQMNSPGALIDGQKLDELVFRVTHSSVPVTVWIGPTGGRAYGGAARLVAAAAYAGMAPRTRIGRVEACPARWGRRRPWNGGWSTRWCRPSASSWPSSTARRSAGGSWTRPGWSPGPTARRRPRPRARSASGSCRLTERLLHATASPSVAYLLLVVGLALIVFEFFSVGIGVAGATGAVLLALSAYGLAVLPTTPLGLALVALAFFGFSIDVQAGAPRAWTGIGTVALLVGSWRLFGDGIDIPWLTMLVLVVCVVLLMVSGLPSMVRSRFSTPTIGRESMIGEMGSARTAVDPEGTVSLRGGLWRARTNRATPIGEGDRHPGDRHRRAAAGGRAGGGRGQGRRPLAIPSDIPLRYPQAPTCGFCNLPLVDRRKAAVR